jgi:hypothetical protein
MDPITQQTVLAAAGAAKGDPVYVDDVFSTYLYEGTGATQSINNGIELGSNVGVSLSGKTITDTTGGGANYTWLNNGVFSSPNSDYYYGSIDCYIDYGSAVVSTFYDLAPQGDNSIGVIYNTPTSITGYGSNDGSSWTSLGAESFTTSDWAEGKFTRYHFLSNTTAYRYYRLTVSGTKSLQEWRLGISDSALGQGGLVWFKNRSVGWEHSLFDTERGVQMMLQTPGTQGQYDRIASGDNDTLSHFNNNGFTVESLGAVNGNGNDMVSWTFRKAPGFFDVVTYTGTGSARTIAHNLGSVPGMIIVKVIAGGSDDWFVYHRALGDQRIKLNKSDGASATSVWNNTAPTSSVFSVGTDGGVNGSGETYVAYIFAHDDAQFGTDGDESIINCGSYTGVGGVGPSLNLGFEPQWVMIKNTSTGNMWSNWCVFDNMRGVATGGVDVMLQANTSTQEGGSYTYATNNLVDFTATGLSIDADGSQETAVNQNGDNFIYMAIRRSHKPSESGTEVFAIDYGNSSSSTPCFDSGFPVDFAFKQPTYASSGNNPRAYSRLQGTQMLYTPHNYAEGTEGNATWDSMSGFYKGDGSAAIAWMFKRAPGFMDVVAYSGTGSIANHSHNLTVIPEMMIVKCRNSSEHWRVYAAPVGATKALQLNSTSETNTADIYWNDTAPTSSVFTVGNYNGVNGSGNTYVNYLFATLPGISKVGSYTGTGSAINVDCGFTNGARFVLIKCTDYIFNPSVPTDWFVWDTLRGIVSGNDPYLVLNTTAAQVTNTDYIDPLSTGFTVTSSAPPALNASGNTYIFLAIA